MNKIEYLADKEIRKVYNIISYPLWLLAPPTDELYKTDKENLSEEYLICVKVALNNIQEKKKIWKLNYYGNRMCSIDDTLNELKIIEKQLKQNLKK